MPDTKLTSGDKRRGHPDAELATKVRLLAPRAPRWALLLAYLVLRLGSSRPS